MNKNFWHILNHILIFINSVLVGMIIASGRFEIIIFPVIGIIAGIIGLLFGDYYG